MWGAIKVHWLIGLLITVGVTGCMTEQELSRTPRTAVEQLLLTHAIEQALVNMAVQLPRGVAVEVEATGLESDRSRMRMMTSSDKGTSIPGTANILGTMNSPSREIFYIRDTVAAELGRMGYRIGARDTESAYLIRAMVESFGTMQGIAFFGMPAVQSVLIPFALPEITLYRRINQTAYARLHLDVYDYRTGEFLGSTAKLVGHSFYNQYTVFFFLTWMTTDMTAPP
jgi:hypothetical protein